ncbi:transposase [Mycetohabitans sp. B4]|nr:transposase [Mycetohabitans sp. B3]MCG1019841.1 transposase [Mycetohabitans sp. B4]
MKRRQESTSLVLTPTDNTKNESFNGRLREESLV